MTMPPLSRQLYVQQVLDLYRQAPGVIGHLRRSNPQLAGIFHDRGLSLELVRAAILLAVARRTLRAPSAPPLPPIASLHYIRPVIDELLAQPLEPGYLNYIRHKLAPFAPEFVAGYDHQLPRSHAHRLS